MPGEQDVTGVTAVHNALGHVDASAGDVRLFVKIDNFIDRAAVNSHAHAKLGMFLEFLANFQSA